MTMFQSTLFDKMATPEVINLKMGAPGEAALKKCSLMMREAANHRLQQPENHLLFQYGPALGEGHFKASLAEFLTAEYKLPVDKADLVVTAGATQGLHLLASAFFSSGDIVFTESLTYFLALKILRDDLNLSLRSVAIDEHGLDPVALENALDQQMQTAKWQQWHPSESRPFRAILYIMPVFHNPTGVCLSADRCKRVIHLARKYDLLVVCDDVYNLLYFPSAYSSSPPRLFSYDIRSDEDYAGNIVSNCSFSKIFGPGVRLGWLEAPPRLVKILASSGLCNSGGSFNHMTSGLMTSVIELGLLKKHIEETRSFLERNSNDVCGLLKLKVPELQIIPPKGGYFIWAKLPPSISMTASELSSQCCADLNVMFFGGEGSSPDGAYTDFLRLSFAHYQNNVLVEAVNKVAGKIGALTS